MRTSCAPKMVSLTKGAFYLYFQFSKSKIQNCNRSEQMLSMGTAADRWGSRWSRYLFVSCWLTWTILWGEQEEVHTGWGRWQLPHGVVTICQPAQNHLMFNNCWAMLINVCCCILVIQSSNNTLLVIDQLIKEMNISFHFSKQDISMLALYVSNKLLMLYGSV